MTLTPGSRLGPYEIIAAIGAGGMGEVYRAKDTKLGREVAIKVLPSAFAQDHERVARFRREAQVLATFNHPNIAAIHGFEESPEGVAIALELVQGEDLQQRLRRGPIPVEEAREIARQIALGLEAAHEKGIVHRDLKPANVKVTPDGQVKVLDFGLAKAFDSDQAANSSSNELTHSPTLSRHATEAGVVLGTAAYMSPEQARGRPLDKRADIWSFGVVLFEMLAGRRLFTGETASDTLAAVLRQDIDWSLLPKKLGSADRRLIDRCLTRDPNVRLRDIGEARIALGAPIEVASEPAAAGRPVNQRREVLKLGAAAAAGVLGGASFVTWRSGKGEAGQPQTLQVTPLTASGNVISVSISPDGRLIAYVESDRGLQSLWLQQVESGQTLRLIPERGMTFWSHVFTPDGNAIIFGEKSADDPKGGLYSISTLGGAPRRLVSDIDSPPTFSPDGERMAFTRQEFPDPDQTALMVCRKDGTDVKPLAVFRRPERVAGLFYGGPTWSPDGRNVVTAVNRAGGVRAEARAWLVSVSVADGTIATVADPGWVAVTQAQFLPDGRSLLAIARSPQQSDAQLWKVSLPSGLARTLTADLNDHRIVSLTRDGKTLVSVTGDVSSAVWLGSLRGEARPRRLGRGRSDGLNGVTFGETGRAVYTTFAGRWRLVSADLQGGERETLAWAEPGDVLNFPTVTAAGATYVFSRGQTGGEIKVIEKGAITARSVCRSTGTAAVSRDGSFLVYPRAAENGGPVSESGYVDVARGSAATQLVRRDIATSKELVLTNLRAFLPAVDPSGRRVAFYFNTPEGAFRIGVCSAEGGPLLWDLPAEPLSTVTSRLVLRDEGLYLNTVAGDRSNVWFQPLDGGPARRITSYSDQLVFDFAISDDGESLLVARGPRLRDAQMMTGF
jgi:serine/threonine protein kinase/Tol biopolymer transport system component